MRRLKQLASPFLRVGTAYNETAKRWPFPVGVATTVLKTTAADLFAQKVVERKEEVDWRRNALFTFFGFAYLGCFQYWLYNDLFVKICKPITAVVGHLGAAPVKTFIDQCIHHPLFYFPAFYVLKGTVEGRPLASSIDKYKEDLWENCKALWTVWVPAQLMNFSVVPLHLRIPFVAGVSFAWTVIISCMRGALDTHEDPAEIPLKEMHPGPQPQSSGQSQAMSSPEEVEPAPAVAWSAGAGQQPLTARTAATTATGALS